MTAGSGAPVRTPKGMHDVLWPESHRWEAAVARFAALVQGAGYGLTLTPVLEHAGVFLRGIGEGNEVVGKEMYVFEDRDGQLMALRPEGTAPIVRAFVQHHPVPPPGREGRKRWRGADFARLPHVALLASPVRPCS